MLTRENHIAKLKKIDFFKDDVHPEYLPFVGEDYAKYRILHIGESHYVSKDSNLTLKDYEGWWEGKQSAELSELADGWYNTNNIVSWYMQGKRHKGHGIFTNVLKSFCNVVVPSESFDVISDENSRKYNYFAYMNFYQMPSLRYGENFTEALYKAGKESNVPTEKLDAFWYECMEKSVNVFEDVVTALDPLCILVSSMEVEKYYKRYGSKNNDGTYAEGRLYNDPRMVYVDHPDSAWWNRKKNGETKTSKEKFESCLRNIYCR